MRHQREAPAELGVVSAIKECQKQSTEAYLLCVTPLFGGATLRKFDSLQKSRDVFFGAGGPGERRAVVHQLPGHDERVSPLQLAVVPLAVMMNSEAVCKH